MNTKVITKEDLEKIEKENPTLRRNGFEKKLNWIQNVFKNYEEIKFKEFEKCVEWMSDSNLLPTKTYSIDSYELKHLVENTVGMYIPNGAVIAAAIYLNIPRKQDSLNMRFKAKYQKTSRPYFTKNRPDNLES